MKKVLHYVNQFFAGIGGEKDANFKPTLIVNELPPVSLQLNDALENAQVVATIVCGDNYYGENIEKAEETILEMVKDINFDYIIAGPAFRAGRYGVACGGIAKKVAEKYNAIPIVSMNDENPGVEMWKKDMYVLKGGPSARSMKDNVKALANACDKLIKENSLGPAKTGNFFERGIRHIDFTEIEPASKRAVDMIVAKIKGAPFTTELPIPKSDMVPIAPSIKDISKIKVALVTSGGIVPKDNPDKIQSASATRWGKYNISNDDRLSNDIYKTIHAGYDPAAADDDPNRVVPLDVLKDMQKEGIIGSIDEYFYSTVGTGTTENEAKRMGLEIAEILKNNNVDAVLLTST